MQDNGSEKLGGRGPAQPLGDLAGDTDAEYERSGTPADTTGQGLRPRSTDPLSGGGSDTGPHVDDRPIDPNRDISGRSGADTGAGSHGKTGMAAGDLDPATGGLGDRSAAGSASPSRSRERTAVYGTDTEPLVGGAARPAPQRKE